MKGVASTGLLFAGLFARQWVNLQEVRAGLVQRANGRVVWQGHGYRAQVPGHTLDVSGFRLAPGTYTFSFLPRSGRVVTAELVAPDPPAQAKAELLHALAVAHHFNVDDLPAYRAGQLGSAGLGRLIRAWPFPICLMLGAGLALAAALAIFNGFGRIDLLYVLVIAAAVFGLWGLGGAVLALILTFDLLVGRVASAEDWVRRYTKRSSGGADSGPSTSYYYAIDKQKWSVSAEAYKALIDGPKYRVYYLPGSKELIGLEPIGDIG